MNKIIGLAAALFLLQSPAFGQSGTAAPTDLNYNYLELRFVDLDNDGDGLRLYGSYDLRNDWIVVGGLTSVDFGSSVDLDIFEIGGGYIWEYAPNWDLVSTVRFVRASVDTPAGSDDDNGFALSGGVRGFLAPQLEIRGSVNHINLDNSDTYLELAADYYFARQFSAGISVEFAGDSDLFSVGARWYFR